MKNLYTAITVLLFSLTWVSAQDAGVLKERMDERLPQIVALKLPGKVGENNKGYLTSLKELTEAEAKVVQAENADRRSVYTLIANQIGTTVEIVAEKRANQIRSVASKGTMIQTPEGNWVAKD